jgi:hypothetical protein
MKKNSYPSFHEGALLAQAKSMTTIVKNIYFREANEVRHLAPMMVLGISPGIFFGAGGGKEDLGVFYNRVLGLGITKNLNFLLVQSAKGWSIWLYTRIV